MVICGSFIGVMQADQEMEMKKNIKKIKELLENKY